VLAPQRIEVWPVQLPGREARFSEPALTRSTELIATLASAIRPFLDGPYALFGHSMGSLLALELARALREQSLPAPVCLFVSGRHPPHLSDRDTPAHLLPEPQFIERLRKLEGTPEAVLNNRELLDLMLPVLRSDFKLLETHVYQPGLPLECPLRVFGGERDADTLQDLEAWREHSRRFLGVRMLPGGHFFLNEQRAPLLQQLTADLLPLLG
jgi:surfactin synthase thioesterase subunit